MSYLRQVRKALGLNQSEMADLLGIMQQAYSKIENGEGLITSRYLLILLEKENVNPAFLLNGTGTMFLDKSEINELLDDIEQKIDNLRKLL